MDNMTMLIIVLGALGLGSLATFLLLSIKDLKKKQEDVDAWKTRVHENPNGFVSAPAHNPHFHANPTLEELQRQIAAINTRMQANTLSPHWPGLESQQLNVLSSENRRLLEENRQLRDEIVDLELWLHRTPVSQGLADARRHKLEQELASLESESRAIRARLGGNKHSEGSKSVQDRLEELEKLYAGAVAENARLLSGSHEHSNNVEGQDNSLQARSQRGPADTFNEGGQPVDPYANVAPQEHSDHSGGKVIPWPRERALPTEDHDERAEFDDRPSLASGVEDLDNGQSDLALRELDKLLRDNPENRELKLYHLLVTVRLRGIAGCEKRIDAIKDMAGLSPVESRIARELFIARAEAAGELGDRAAMQHYRRWADVLCPASQNADAGELFPTLPFGTDTKADADASTTSVKATEKKSWFTDHGTGNPVSLRYAAGIGLVISTGIFSVLFAWVTMVKPAAPLANGKPTTVASAEVVKTVAAK